MAEGISPKMSAKVFMARGEFENELKQVGHCTSTDFVCKEYILGLYSGSSAVMYEFWMAQGDAENEFKQVGLFADNRAHLWIL